jgi:hypothetical protein
MDVDLVWLAKVCQTDAEGLKRAFGINGGSDPAVLSRVAALAARRTHGLAVIETVRMLRAWGKAVYQAAFPCASWQAVCLLSLKDSVRVAEAARAKAA